MKWEGYLQIDYRAFEQIERTPADIERERMERALGQLNMGSIQSAVQRLPGKDVAHRGLGSGLYEIAQDQKYAQDNIKQLQQSLTPKQKEKKHMFGFAKEYLDKHKDTVMTVVVALLVDHFFLGGALREKIKSITESILDNAQKKLSHTPALENKDANKAA